MCQVLFYAEECYLWFAVDGDLCHTGAVSPLPRSGSCLEVFWKLRESATPGGDWKCGGRKRCGNLGIENCCTTCVAWRERVKQYVLLGNNHLNLCYLENTDHLIHTYNTSFIYSILNVQHVRVLRDCLHLRCKTSVQQKAHSDKFDLAILASCFFHDACNLFNSCISCVYL